MLRREPTDGKSRSPRIVSGGHESARAEPATVRVEPCIDRLLARASATGQQGDVARRPEMARARRHLRIRRDGSSAHPAGENLRAGVPPLPSIRFAIADARAQSTPHPPERESLLQRTGRGTGHTGPDFRIGPCTITTSTAAHDALQGRAGSPGPAS